MALTLVTPPVAVPVAIEQLQAHLRVEAGDDDVYLQHCLDTAIAQFDGAEGELGRALISQTWQETFAGVPTAGRALELFLSPVSSVTKAEVFNSSGVWEQVPAGAVELFESDGRFCVAPLAAWPQPGKHRAPLRIEYVAGYGGDAGSIPKPLCHAVLLFAAHLYNAREPVVFDGTPIEVPLSIERLISAFKIWWR